MFVHDLLITPHVASPVIDLDPSTAFGPLDDPSDLENLVDDLDRRLALGRLPEELFLDPIVVSEQQSDSDNDILGPDLDDYDDRDDAADRTPKLAAPRLPGSRTSNTSEFPLPFLSSNKNLPCLPLDYPYITHCKFMFKFALSLAP